ncbi:MAG: MGMT family protein [Bacillota bacterium]|nr:MGMT family protein [Bacillota bacterium]
MGFYQSVYEAVKRIPEGKVATYGQIAFLTGRPRAARIVGFALHVNPFPGKVPCHRVVNRDGRLASSFAFGGEEVQRAMLLKEGVRFTESGFVDMDKCGWDGNEL